jgi:signal transduction histidine kinase
MIQRGARDPEHLRLLRELQLRSYLIVPMVARDRTLGAITLVAAESGRNYRPSDLSLAEDLASRAALALDNARLYQEAQEQAEAHVLLNEALRETVGERNEAIQRLEDLLRSRDEFLAAAAHDLKNPLAGIKNTVQLLARRVRSNRLPDLEHLAEALDRVDRTVSRAAAQVEELLDLTRLQMGQSLELDRAPTDLVAIIQDVVANQSQRSTGHVIRLEANPSQIRGEWDARRLSRVVANLLDNAIRYSPAGGSITVTLGLDGNEQNGSVVLAVQDSGIGIPADDLPRIFERFHRASNVRGRIAGTGVGLASACSIVEAHGGTIDVESVEGSGSTFTVRLPIGVGMAGRGDTRLTGGDL